MIKLPAELAEELAQRVRNLRPDRHDPERFHVDRDLIFAELRGLAVQLRGAPARPVYAFNPRSPLEPSRARSALARRL